MMALGSRRRMLFLRRWMPLISPVLILVIVAVSVFLVYKSDNFSSSDKNAPDNSKNKQSNNKQSNNKQVEPSTKDDQGEKKVLGGKTQENSQVKDSNSISVSAPVPFPLTSYVDESAQETEPKEKSIIPENLTAQAENSKLNIHKGSMLIRVYADWVQDEMVIFWGNFDGKSKENLFEIAGRGSFIVFNTYDENQGKDSLEAELPADYKGQTFEVEIKWDFNTKPGQKKIYINGELASEEELDPVPVKVNPDMLIESNVEILKITE